jgi:hypothetical protein
MFTIDLRHVGIRTDGTGRRRLLIEKRDLPMSRPPKPKADRANKKTGFNLSFFLLCRKLFAVITDITPVRSDCKHNLAETMPVRRMAGRVKANWRGWWPFLYTRQTHR